MNPKIIQIIYSPDAHSIQSSLLGLDAHGDVFRMVNEVWEIFIRNEDKRDYKDGQ